MSYDPRPRRKGRRPRKGVEPAGLKRWRLAHRTHDPRPRRRHLGRHLGHRRMKADPRPRRHRRYGFRRHYDPAARRRRFGGFRGAGGKIERGLSGKWGWLLGGLAALGYGVYQGWTDTSGMMGGQNVGAAYTAQITGGTVNGVPVRASIANLWSKGGYYKSPLSYLCYRFTGYNPDNKQWAESAWVAPFWASVAGLVASILPLGAKARRYQKPIKAIASGGLIASTIGALALPATDITEAVNSRSRATRSDIPINYEGQPTNAADTALKMYMASGDQTTGGARRFLIAV